MNVINPSTNNVPNTLTRIDDKRNCLDLRKARRAGDGLCFFMGLELGNNDAAFELNNLCAIL